MRTLFFLNTFLLFTSISTDAIAQITNRERPREWDALVHGGRFMNRFLPMPIKGSLTKHTWGADNVIPRYIDNGIEDNVWSYWGGNALLGDDDNYHLFVCRLREDAEKGHMEWPKSLVVHAVSENSIGPYTIWETIRNGYNPETFRLNDGDFTEIHMKKKVKN